MLTESEDPTRTKFNHLPPEDQRTLISEAIRASDDLDLESFNLTTKEIKSNSKLNFDSFTHKAKQALVKHIGIL